MHRLYFEPEYPEFSARTMWSLSNAFTSAFKKLDPIPQFKATVKLGGFSRSCPHDQGWPVLVSITPNGSASSKAMSDWVSLIRLGRFPEPRTWPTSGLPKTRDLYRSIH